MENSYTSPREIKKRQKMKEAMEYRLQGYSYSQIAEAMDTDGGTAYRLVDEAMKEIIREPVERVKDMELRRLDAMLSGIFNSAVEGDGNQIERVLRIMERRTRYLGLDFSKPGWGMGPGTEDNPEGGGGPMRVIIIENGLPNLCALPAPVESAPAPPAVEDQKAGD